MKKVKTSGQSMKPEELPVTSSSDTILYVEDQIDNWNVALLHLGRRYRMVHAATDAEACAVVRTEHERLFVILMDIQLRGSALNGVELTRLFRSPGELPNVPPYARELPTVSVPIFFVTAYADSYAESSLLRLGASGVIAKPVDFLRLMRALTGLHLKAAELK
jgi:CheY-like chemotaxis protein